MNLSPRVSRFLALSILLFLVLALVFYGLLPIGRYYADRIGEVRGLNNQLTRYQNLLANEEKINELARQMDAGSEETELFLNGSKTSIASANLREFLNEAVQRSGGQLVSSQEYEADPVPSTIPVGLRLQVSSEVQNLVDLLYDLETARPIIFIDNLSLAVIRTADRSSRLRRSRTTRVQATRNSLNIRMDIVGYLAGESG